MMSGIIWHWVRLVPETMPKSFVIRWPEHLCSNQNNVHVQVHPKTAASMPKPQQRPFLIASDQQGAAKFMTSASWSIRDRVSPTADRCQLNDVRFLEHARSRFNLRCQLNDVRFLVRFTASQNCALFLEYNEHDKHRTNHVCFRFRKRQEEHAQGMYSILSSSVWTINRGHTSSCA